MDNTRKYKNVKDLTVLKALKEIDTFFRDIEKDKTLPTFADFFMLCLILGIEERVNLRVMYPKVYKKLHRSLETHANMIRLLQSKKK